MSLWPLSLRNLRWAVLIESATQRFTIAFLLRLIDVNYFGRLAPIILAGDRQVVLGHGDHRAELVV